MQSTRTYTHLAQLGLVALIASQTLGCPDDKEDPSSSTNNTQGDMADMMPDIDMDDMGGDEGTDTDMSADMADMTACTPLTECPVDVCGDVSDGCGGTLACEPCACVDGVPSTPTCGACGWGETSCASDTGDGEAICSLSELAGMPSDCDAVIYVSATSGAAGADGSKEMPFATIAEALDQVKRGGVSALAIEQGDYEISGGFDVVDGVHVIGGFKPGFEWNPEGRSRFVIVPRPIIEPFQSVGVSVVDVTQKTLFMNVDVYVSDAAALPNNHLTAFYARNATGLHIENSDISAGAAGPGFNGKTGQDGRDGEDGGDAAMTTTVQGRATQPDPAKQINGADSGIGGVNELCRNQASGGAGGEGAHIRYEDVNNANSPITPVAAFAGFVNSIGVEGGAAGTMASPDGQNGQDGTSGVDGSSGTGGSIQGSITLGYWQQNGRDGGDGTDGTAGTGGTGGGGSYWQEFKNPVQDSQPGLSGGGGAAGGCGGEAGGGGAGGGSGFGMLLVDSTGVVLKNVQIQAPDAQNGGNSGQGGRGGLGGQGGEPSTMYSLTRSGTPVPHAHSAGQGGNGANGGDGGEGGGGAGGSSFGIWCEGTQVEQGEGVEAKAGNAGTGGSGAELGEDGIAKDVEKCW